MDGMRRLGVQHGDQYDDERGLENYAATRIVAINKNNNVALRPSSVHAADQVEVLPERLQYGQPKHSRRLRVLFGILTADFKSDEAYRKRHRTLFKLWNDKRVCSLPDFKSMPLEDRYECEIIYTFVIAANPEAPTELVDESRPFEIERPYQGTSRDLNEPDVTLLNIK